MFAIFIVAFFVVFFWAAYEQAGSSMNLFADRNTDLTVGVLSSIPAAWFQSVNPAFILIFSPVFAWIWACSRSAAGAVDRHEDGDRALSCSATGFLFMVVGGEGRRHGHARELDLAQRPPTSSTRWASSASRRSASRT